MLRRLQQVQVVQADLALPLHHPLSTSGGGLASQVREEKHMDVVSTLLNVAANHRTGTVLQLFDGSW